MNALSDPIWDGRGGVRKPNAWDEYRLAHEAPEEIEPVDLFADDPGGAPTLGPQHVPSVIWSFAFDTAARMGVDPTAVAFAAMQIDVAIGRV